MKKFLSVLLAAMMVFSLGAFAGAEETDTGVLPAIAGENGTTYINLFDKILGEDCYQIWFLYR